LNLITSVKYIAPSEFEDVYEQARRIPPGGTVRGFINYLKRYEERKI
jgi:hypothetical protein